MADFFVEFRFHGYAKHQLRALVREVAHKFRVRGATRRRPVPHMALFYGGTGTANIRQVCDAVERVAGDYSLVPFEIDGFEWREGDEGRVLAARINASPELRHLRKALADELGNLCSLHRFDAQPDFWFHTTIAFKDIDRKFDRIWHYLNRRERPHIRQHLTRITVLNRNREIQAEYDLILGRRLSRREALDRKLHQRTTSQLEELTGEAQFSEARTSLRQLVRRIFGRRHLYLIGDTHFDHGNIIRYTDRPFQNVEAMNTALVAGWNATVLPGDTVYFLGDWSFGRGSRPHRYWIGRLQGRIKSIKGSHDPDDRSLAMSDFHELSHKGYRFLLIHNPDRDDPKQTESQKRKLEDWHGWIIHGHKHSNDLKDYPFINGEQKTINVSVELIGYRPLSIERLLSLNIDSIRRMETLNGQPERWRVDR